MNVFRNKLQHMSGRLEIQGFVAEITVLASLVCVLGPLLGYSQSFNVIGVCLSITAAAGLCLMLRYFLFGVVLASSCALLGEVTTVGYAVSFFVVMLSICTAWGYSQKNIRRSILLPLILSSALAISWWFKNRGLDFEASIIYFSLCFLPWMAGRTIRRKNEANELLEAKYKLEKVESELSRRKRESNLAKDMHDSVSNDLSTILLLMEGNQESFSKEQVEIIAERSRHALNEVHRIIDILGSEEQSDRGAHARNQVACSNLMSVSDLQQWCEQKDKDLSCVGLTGASRVSVEGDSLFKSTHIPSELHGLIEEIYANIIRHCTPNQDEYSIIIHVGLDGWRIIQTNTCLSGVKRLIGVPSGKGLALHKAAIENAGGTLTTNFEDSTWMLNCWIPRLTS